MTITVQTNAPAAVTFGPSNAETNAFFEGLRELLAACGPKPDRNDAAVVLITACIEGGWDTRPRIVGALKRLGLDHRHVAIILKRGTGDNPRLHRWKCDAEGRYTLHEDEPRG